MKVIFLDFDGVLNYRKYCFEHSTGSLVIDPERMVLLKKIVDATDAKIVLSTSWREYWSSMPEKCHEIGLFINNIFKKHGMEIYDKIPKLRVRREQEIEMWLKDYPQVENFVVLDDTFLDAQFMRGHFVKTCDFRNGLEASNVEEAIKILTAEEQPYHGIGAIVGDVVGSVYAFGSDKTKDFELFGEDNCLTDDSYMTIAVGRACEERIFDDEAQFKSTLIYWMRYIGRQHLDADYGAMFYKWLRSDIMPAYHSFGNGSAMRVSPVAWFANTLEEAEKLAAWSSEVTHNHPEGIKGAKAIASAIFLARGGKNKEEIKAYIEQNYYKLNFTLEEIRPNYDFDVTCQGSVPQAIQCFLEAEDFEDTIRNAISLGGDGDTLAAMAGAIAEPYFGIPLQLKTKTLGYFDEDTKQHFIKYSEMIRID